MLARPRAPWPGARRSRGRRSRRPGRRAAPRSARTSPRRSSRPQASIAARACARRSSSVQSSTATPTIGQSQQAALLEPVQRPERHHLRQVAGDAEDDEDVRRLVAGRAPCGRGLTAVLMRSGCWLTDGCRHPVWVKSRSAHPAAVPAPPHHLGHEVRARAGADLVHRVAHVRADGVVGDAELVGDLRTGVPERDVAARLSRSRAESARVPCRPPACGGSARPSARCAAPRPGSAAGRRRPRSSPPTARRRGCRPRGERRLAGEAAGGQPGPPLRPRWRSGRRARSRTRAARATGRAGARRAGPSRR